LPVKPKIISLTPAEAGQNTVKQREYNPGRAICANAEHGGPAISVFSLNGFHRFFRDEASPVRNSQAERC
jgi:hypothetical protein